MTPTPGTGSVRVILADDDTLVRRGIATIISSDPQIEVVGQAANGREAGDLARSRVCDVLLMDIRMPGMDGLAALEAIRVDLPELAVVMLTTFAEGEYVTRALTGGAAGFLLKTAEPQELIMGIRAAADGGACFSPRIARWLVDQYGPKHDDRRDGARRRVHGLTERQRDVLAVLGTGASNAEIGRRLHLSEGTVKAYVSDLLDRLQARNRVDAAIIAYEAGLLD